MSDDDDKTVFGGPLPGAKPTPPAGNDKTVIGGALPPGGQPAPPIGRPATPPPAPGGNTWLGGNVPAPGGNMGRPAAPTDGFFPEIPQETPQQAAPLQTPRISLEEALRAKGLGQGGPSNPLLAAAANLLILFGRLRTGMVEMQAQPLMEHVTRELNSFEQNAVSAGADPHEAQVAKYALCGTADDIVQNLPGADKGVWIQYSMVARFFQRRDSGVGFFQEAEKAMQAPAQRFDLLELMLVCMSLGFEGQYRTAPNGAVELARVRSAIYETLRRVKPRPDDDISVKWAGVPMTGRRKFGGLPLWIYGGIAAALVVGTFATLSTLINRDGNTVATELTEMHPNVTQISLVRNFDINPFVPPAGDESQLERITDALSDQIAEGAVEVGTKGDFIFIRVGNALLFNSGSVDVKPEFQAVAGPILNVLNAERGPVRVVGFTDSIPLSGRGRFRTNQELSVARAEGVAAILRDGLSAPSCDAETVSVVTDNGDSVAVPLNSDAPGCGSAAERLSVEGLGEADPIGDNATAEGRALNRRVEILLAREGTF
ncbi:type IVB secretion system protein IcmH/DotU [Yoonia sp. SS1-5]|uniref:Type IVB secretion system protein IcmH/DotU n=1 Tax=Yoonia rhodophyticola TaxID=3137370 RepID=A0AAN0MKX7_9RHOB